MTATINSGPALAFAQVERLRSPMFLPVNASWGAGEPLGRDLGERAWPGPGCTTLTVALGQPAAC
jgi:hypothetical protein